jgi:hypothetical protein
MRKVFSMGIKTILVLLLSVSFSLPQEKQGATDKHVDNLHGRWNQQLNIPPLPSSEVNNYTSLQSILDLKRLLSGYFLGALKDYPISYGRFFLTYYSRLGIFNPSIPLRLKGDKDFQY